MESLALKALAQTPGLLGRQAVLQGAVAALHHVRRIHSQPLQAQPVWLAPNAAVEPCASSSSCQTCSSSGSERDSDSKHNIMGLIQGLLEEQRQQAAAAQQGTALTPQTPGGCFQDQTEVKMESQVIFESCWRRFTDKHRAEDLTVPREVIWLNGAPGSGKGVNTPHILQARGMTQSICLSSLLTVQPEARKFIDAGEMISDSLVGDVLLSALLAPPEPRAGQEFGVVVDGFPRTALQVDFLKLLMDKLRFLHLRFADTPVAPRFPRTSFKVVVLYVDEETSVRRQMQRAVAAQAHNRKLLDAGAGGPLRPARPTDVDLEKARKRYTIFKQHYSALLRLKQFFPFHLIDAMGSLADTQEQITQELRYQSSLDLNEETYGAIRHLPLATDLQRTARQQLVSRLDGYCTRQRPLFGRVLGLIDAHVVPRLRQGGLAGQAEWVTAEGLFREHPVAVDMLLDVLSDRGFQASYVEEQQLVASKVDLATGELMLAPQPLHRFRVRFEAPSVRNANTLKAMEIAARVAEAARTGAAAAAAAGMAPGAAGPLLREGVPPAAAAAAAAAVSVHAPITESFIPQHLDVEKRLKRKRKEGSSSSSSGVAGSRCASACGSSSSDEEFVMTTLKRCTRKDVVCNDWEEVEVAVPAS